MEEEYLTKAKIWFNQEDAKVSFISFPWNKVWILLDVIFRNSMVQVFSVFQIIRKIWVLKLKQSSKLIAKDHRLIVNLHLYLHFHSITLLTLCKFPKRFCALMWKGRARNNEIYMLRANQERGTRKWLRTMIVEIRFPGLKLILTV